MKRSWSFTNNPFLNCSKNSFPAMRKVGNFTVNALHKYPLDTFLAERYAAIAPLNKKYSDNYRIWDTQQATQLSNTASFKTLKKLLSSKLARKWDSSVQLTYDKDTDEYLAFFPHHRTPFQNGSNLSIMGAVTALSGSLGKDIALTVLNAEVAAFDTLLNAAFQKQQGEVADTVNSSDNLEDARIALGEELYCTLGLMMAHFKSSPEKITNYFDLETIRNHEQSIFRSNIKADELLLALTHTFYYDEEILFINSGNTFLRIALVDDAQSIPSWVNKFVEIHPKSHITIPATDLGELPAARFLKVMNMSLDIAGAYTIELL